MSQDDPHRVSNPDRRSGRRLTLGGGASFFAGLASLAAYAFVSPMPLLAPPPPVCSGGSCVQLALVPLTSLGIIGGVLILLSSLLSARAWSLALVGTGLVLIDFVIFLPLHNFPTLASVASTPVAALFYLGLFLLVLAMVLGAAGGLRKLGAHRNRSSTLSPPSPAS
jgi:hypothetical protein